MGEVSTIALSVRMSAEAKTAALYGFQPNYAPAVTVASLVLFAVAAAACLVPTRRASRLNPMTALPHD